VIVNKQKAEEISEQNKQKLIPIQDKFEPLDINGTQISIIKYGRVFESEKDLTILYGKKLKKSKTYHAHLFNDCFLLSTQHKTKYLLEYNYKYKQVKISEREENRIEIESLIDEVKFVCECVSLEEKKEWMILFNEKLKVFQVNTLKRYQFNINSPKGSGIGFDDVGSGEGSGRDNRKKSGTSGKKKKVCYSFQF